MSQTPLPSYPPGNAPQPSFWSGPRDAVPKMKPEGIPGVGGIPPVIGPVPVPTTPAPLPTYTPIDYRQQHYNAEAVRGKTWGYGGPRQFDPSFIQNLSTFAAQNFQRPSGSIEFNPLATAQGQGGLERYGTPQGGGNAPLMGSPQTLLWRALMNKFGGR